MRLLRSITIAGVLVALFATSASAGSSYFTGAWESIDADGSYQVMTISGIGPDGRTRMTLFDSFGTICVTVGASSTTFHGLADAWTNGGVLEFTWRHVGCGSVEAFYELGGGTLISLTATDQLIDSGGIVWSRLR